MPKILFVIDLKILMQSRANIFRASVERKLYTQNILNELTIKTLLIELIYTILPWNTNHITTHRSQNDIQKIEKQIENWSLLFFRYFSRSDFHACACKRKKAQHVWG